MRYESFLAALVSPIAAISFVVGCNGDTVHKQDAVSFVTDYAPISFSFPAHWKKNPEEHPYDLQALSEFEDMSTGVFVFKDVDLAADANQVDILREQIEDLRSKRANFRELEPIQEMKSANKTVSSITYVGEKDSLRTCFHFSLIEFREDKSKFAVTVQTVRPGGWEEAKPLFDRIIQSATPLRRPE